MKKLLIIILTVFVTQNAFLQENDNPLKDYNEYTTQKIYLKTWSLATKMLSQTKILELNKSIYIFTFKDHNYQHITVYKSFVIEDIDAFMEVLKLYLNQDFEKGVMKNFTFEDYQCKAYRNALNKTSVAVKHKYYEFEFLFTLKDLKHIEKGLLKRQ